MRNRTCSFLLLLTGFTVLLAGSAPCAAQDVAIQVTQVKASNAGGDVVDPALGDLGDKLKEKYRYRNFKLVGSTSHSAAKGGSADYALANGMTLTVKGVSVAENTVELNLSIPGVTAFTVKARNGATFLTSVPWDKDVLVLAIRPSF